MKQHFEEYKKNLMPNGGEPLLQRTQQVVRFDPDNPHHLEVVDLLFFTDDIHPQPDKGKIEEHIEWCYKQEELKMRRASIGIRFKLEGKYNDIQSMVRDKIVRWRMAVHRISMQKTEMRKVLHLPRTG